MVDEYISYLGNLENIKRVLGIAGINIVVRPETKLYVTKIYQYLWENLATIDEHKDRIQKVEDIFSEGSDLICNREADKLWESINESSDTIDYEIFTFTWSNILSTILERLRIQYADLYITPIDYDCPGNCKPGETQGDWENYRSGVWSDEIDSSELCNCNRRIK